MCIIWNPTSRDLWFDLAIKLKWEDILKSLSSRSVHSRDWLVATRASNVIAGIVNPSNKRYLTNWYTGDAFKAAEFDAIFNALKKVLLN